MQQRRKRRRSDSQTRRGTTQRRSGTASRRRRAAPTRRTVPAAHSLRTEEQRRRAAAIRREKRRREQRRKRIIQAVAGLLAGVVLITVVRGHHRGKKTDDWSEQSIIAVGGEEQEELSMEDTIRQNPEDYPESLLNLLDRNPETLQFVYDYPTQHELTHDIDLTSQVAEGGIPLFLQWDERWGYETYGSDMLAITGCGPTCLSMVLCGLNDTADWTPLRVAQYADEHGYYVEGSGTAWTLMTDGASDLGLSPERVSMSDGSIRKQLEAGKPIICSMGPGDFTDAGHYIVLVGLNDDGTIEIRDPNSPKRSAKNWVLEELTKQMKTLWAYT